MLFEVMITDMMVICGANENENRRLGRVMDKNLDWKLLWLSIAKNTNATFLFRNKKEGNTGRPSLTIHGAS